MKTKLQKLNEQIDNIEAEIKVTIGSRRAKLQAQRIMLIEKRRKMLLKKPAVETRDKALLIVALMIMSFAGYIFWATGPDRCQSTQTWTGLPCPRAARPDRFCSTHEPLEKGSHWKTATRID
jgi:hypothetical protein